MCISYSSEICCMTNRLSGCNLQADCHTCYNAFVTKFGVGSYAVLVLLLFRIFHGRFSFRRFFRKNHGFCFIYTTQLKSGMAANANIMEYRPKH